MKFIHMADCHLGGWRIEKLRELNMTAFVYVIDEAISQSVDFVIISGDLFNSAIPSIDIVKDATMQLDRLKVAKIPVYCIAGSHDYSVTGKTMLDVLEAAKLVKNVFCATIDEQNVLHLDVVHDARTGYDICGIFGRARNLDKTYYQILNHNSIKQPAKTIFCFHAALQELDTGIMDEYTTQLSLLPKNCVYYAGGHVHIRQITTRETHPILVYPGPTYPNSFDELEKLQSGSFVLVEIDQKGVFTPTHKHIPGPNVVRHTIDISHKSQDQICLELEDVVVAQAICLLRFIGRYDSPLQWNSFEQILQEKGAIAVLKNTAKIVYPEFELEQTSVQHLDESQIITQSMEQTQHWKEACQLLFGHMQLIKNEGERVQDFENRIISIKADLLQSVKKAQDVEKVKNSTP